MTLPVELAPDGPTAPPRSNGQLVFAAPWESRTFGMAVALSAGGAFEWSEFQAALADRIKAWEHSGEAAECWNYYRCWQQALEDVLAGRGLVTSDSVAERGEALAERPKGHDHDHGHDHGHDHEH
jgi:nitrile hydratase accessory protein